MSFIWGSVCLLIIDGRTRAFAKTRAATVPLPSLRCLASLFTCSRAAKISSKSSPTSRRLQATSGSFPFQKWLFRIMFMLMWTAALSSSGCRRSKVHFFPAWVRLMTKLSDSYSILCFLFISSTPSYSGLISVLCKVLIELCHCLGPTFRATSGQPRQCWCASFCLSFRFQLLFE